MSSFPKLKTPLRTLPHLLTGVVLGFTVTMLAARLISSFSRGGSSAGTVPAPGSGTLPPSGPVSGKRTVSLGAAGDFQQMEARARLAFALRLRGISAEQRQAFLRDCLQRSGPERTALLSLLLSEWAESEPSAAAEWALSHLKGAESEKCLDDILRTWAARDGKNLAEWADSQFRKHGRDLISRTMDALQRHDPLWFARMSEMECNRDTVWSGMEFDSLRAPGAAKAMSALLEGRVAYIDDPAEMRRELNAGSSARHAKQKWGWNELFENTAVRWHAEDPAACDEWLRTWPENAQAAARHFIAEVESKAQAGPAPEVATELNPERRQNVLSESSDSALSSGQPTLPQPLPDAAAPVSGAADQQLQAWSQWLSRDPAAAEAFLNRAAWPDDLKFRARAEGYATAP